MNALEKLERARDLLVPPLLYSIQTVQLSDEHFTLKITFQNEITLYVNVPAIQDEANDLGPMQTGEAGITTGDNLSLAGTMRNS